MIVPWLVSFVGLALVYALAATAGTLALAALAGRFPGWRVVPFLLSTLFFLFLTQHPFPDPARLVCPAPASAVQLVPFDFWRPIMRLWQRDVGPVRFFGNQFVLATLMNYVLCGLIGMALARHTNRLGVAVLFGLGMTLLVEFTQLTGIWGLYPCAYRQFNVDDLILNSLGVVTGFLLARVWQRRRNMAAREGRSD
jgi:glycopeptide antibiotics resistance protein